MEGSYEWATVAVVSYQIMDSDEVWHHCSNPRDFDAAAAMRDRLQEENPGKSYTLFAELL